MECRAQQALKQAQIQNSKHFIYEKGESKKGVLDGHVGKTKMQLKPKCDIYSLDCYRTTQNTDTQRKDLFKQRNTIQALLQQDINLFVSPT